MTNRNTNKGFTLIELLVVISIISLLSSVVLSAIKTARTRGADAAAQQTITQMKSALEFYYDKYGKYPPTPTGTTNDGLAALYGVTCWDCTGSAAPLDANRLSAVSEFMTPRPRATRNNPLCGDYFGYFYKVSPSGQSYKLALVCSMDITNIPPSMLDFSFVGITASVYAPDTAKTWGIYTTAASLNP
ncbi:MAG: hypothetical protein A2937_00460 [Candidatus Yonathbacteria bacterium RIFCSPLOWO2_01_FULL_47_33b]|uniref:Type II secretion system protein GspG C-terminal domain-containing protein n=1 Tax=Candidatus Yonathbacteria bacterium RIFCSPLOWO2_01_FULL_47_33b TaxID=1802727 RepID=A0A1G2SG78_9BACT|nr:MAG: hypothetical protein A2937_00460 [Candidatus Yonathbacteria bacterium RIFCSPLOWO2_01_FULL_47_33b]